MLDEKYKDNDIVKSLLDAGLDEEYIAKGIENGDIKLDEVEKAKKETKKAEDYDDEQGKVPGEQDTGPDEYDEEDEEEVEKAYNMKKAELDKMAEKLEKIKGKKKVKVQPKKEEKKEIAKSETTDIEKSFENIEKSFSDKLEEISTSLQENFKKSIEDLSEKVNGIKEDVDKMGSKTEGFKAPDNMSFLEKGMPEFKDEGGKTIYHVSKQREQVKEALLKAYDEAEGEIKKSISDELSAYSSDSYADSIDKNVAKHLYENHNIRLVK